MHDKCNYLAKLQPHCAPQLTIKRLPILFHQLLYQAACAPTDGLGHLACVKASAQEERE